MQYLLLYGESRPGIAPPGALGKPIRSASGTVPERFGGPVLGRDRLDLSGQFGAVHGDRKPGRRTGRLGGVLDTGDAKSVSRSLCCVDAS
jgi:hypothetical protein